MKPGPLCYCVEGSDSHMGALLLNIESLQSFVKSCLHSWGLVTMGWIVWHQVSQQQQKLYQTQMNSRDSVCCVFFISCLHGLNQSVSVHTTAKSQTVLFLYSELWCVCGYCPGMSWEASNSCHICCYYILCWCLKRQHKALCVCVCQSGRKRNKKLRIQMKSVITAERARTWHWQCVYTVCSAGVGSLPEMELRGKS